MNTDRYWMPERRGRALRWLTAVAALLLGAGLLAACGDDDDSESTASTDAATSDDPSADDTTDALQGEPIRLGALVAITGRTARQDGPSSKVIEAWASWVNGEGGVDGRPVEVVIKDTKGDSAAAQAAAQELVEDEAVVAVIAVDSVTESVFGEILSEAGLPIVGGHGFQFGQFPNMFGTLATTPLNVSGGPVAPAIVSGAESIGSVVCAENPLCAEAAGLYETVVTNNGQSYENTVTVAFDAPNYTAECLELSDSGVDGVNLAVGGAVAARLISDCLTQDYSPAFALSGNSVTKENLDEIDPEAELVGAIYGFPWWIDTPAAQEYRDVMEQEGVDELDWANTASTATWSSLILFEEAMAGVTDVSRDGVIEAYGSVEDMTLDGLAPKPLTFVADEPLPTNGCFWLYSYTGGEYIAFDDGTPHCLEQTILAPG